MSSWPVEVLCSLHTPAIPLHVDEGKEGLVEERVHRRLLMGPVGIRITDFESRKELIGAFIDIVTSNNIFSFLMVIC